MCKLAAYTICTKPDILNVEIMYTNLYGAYQITREIVREQDYKIKENDKEYQIASHTKERKETTRLQQ